MEPSTSTAVASAPSATIMAPAEAATVLSLPEGCSMMVGEDGEEYVTLVQDGQTYAIPLAEYQNMQPGGTITIQAQQLTSDIDISNAHPSVIVQAPAAAPTIIATSPLNVHTPTIIQNKTPSALVSTPSPGGIKWGMSSGPQSHMTPAGASSSCPPKSLWTTPQGEPRRFKPIRVDNWGIFLLNRLQAYFQKKEYCDLTLRFPTRNAQIKVHKLVVNACTDFFSKAEDNGHIMDGFFDMPAFFLPEMVAPVVKFMYTGRLDMKSPNFGKLRETAEELGMTVLTKLMDVQLNAPPELFTFKKKPKRNILDPVRQIKKIKKIEKKFEREVQQEKMQKKMEARQAVDDVVKESILPGKKLPIWKKRETQINCNTEPELRQQEQPTANLVIKQETSPAKAYGKARDKPFVPRQLREIQENLNFEKVRQTTSRQNNEAEDSNNTDEGQEATKDMSVDEIKEFMDEQRKRLALDDEGQDDDYYDNDAGLDYDEALGDNDEEIDMPMPTTPTTTTTTNQITPATKPILKSAELKEINTPPLPRKSVRFSLRPGSIQTPKNIDASSELIIPDTPEDCPVSECIGITEDITEAIVNVKMPPKKRKGDQNDKQDAMDQTVEEFSKAVEQEEKEMDVATPPMRTRRGRAVVAPNLDIPEQQTTPKPPKKKSITPKKLSAAAAATTISDQNAMISELMKKNPELFKGNKSVKLKVMTKDATGKSVVKVITVKAQPQTSPRTSTTSRSPAAVATKSAVNDLSKNDSTQSIDMESPTKQSSQSSSGVPDQDLDEDDSSFGLRNLPRVKYTGKRGRPPIIKPGEKDPHAKERIAIEEKLHHKTSAKIVVQTADKSSGEAETYTTFEQVSGKLVQVGQEASSSTSSALNSDPSSEAEALSHVASGIAASLGLASEAAASPSNNLNSDLTADHDNTTSNDDDATNAGGPLSDLEHFDTTNNESFENSKQEQPPRGVKRTRNSDANNSSSSAEGSPAKKVVKLAMEWTEDDEDDV